MKLWINAFYSIAAALLCCATLPADAQVAPTLDRIRQNKVILLGYRESAFPFSYVDPSGTPIGYSVELCARIVDGLKRELKLPELRMEWVRVQGSAQRLPFVQEGKIDLECGNTTSTAERQKTVAFTVPIYIAGTGVMVRSNQSAQTIHDLVGKRVVFTSSSTGEKIVDRANQAGLALKPYVVKDNAQAMAALAAGEADAWLSDDILMAGFRAQQAKPTDFRILSRRHTIEPLALMYRKKDLDFSRLVDRELLKLIGGREIQQIYERWFNRPVPPNGVNLEIPASPFLREFWRIPTQMQVDVDVIIL